MKYLLNFGAITTVFTCLGRQPVLALPRLTRALLNRKYVMGAVNLIVVAGGLLLAGFACTPTEPTRPLSVIDIDSPAASHSGEPSFFRTSANEVGLSWLQKGDSANSLHYALYKQGRWTAPQTLVSGKGVLVNWADFPGIQTNGKHWLAWFLQMNNPNTFAYDIMVMQSEDEGVTWTKPQRLHSDSTLTEHGFVSAVPATGGFQLMWLDGRMATDETPLFTLRTAFVGFDGQIKDRVILDDNTCTCCQTTMLSIEKNSFIALYRDHTPEEIRDIARVQFNKGEQPGTPGLVYADEWHIPGCPVNGPRAAIRMNEHAVAWFTMGKQGIATVKFATSSNGGTSYTEPLVVDTVNVGRVDLLANKHDYYLSYIDKQPAGGVITIARIVEGKVVSLHPIVNVSPSRKTGFPRMAFLPDNQGVLLAYTQADSSQVLLKQIKF